MALRTTNDRELEPKGDSAQPPGVPGERSEPGTPGMEGSNPEVSPKPKRRNFTAQYKRRIVEEADRCQKPGEIGCVGRSS